MDVILASPRGFCAGVERAIEIVYRAIDVYFPRKIFVLHEIVHNARVLSDLREHGVSFVEDIGLVPDGAVLIFSAHGVSDKVEVAARSRDIVVVDASCPLVKKVHYEGQNFDKSGYTVILVGHKNHPEVLGTMGRLHSEIFLVSSVNDVLNLQIKNEKVAYITQTTLSIDDTKKIIEALRDKFPNIIGPDLKNICYATQNRQNALKKLVELVDVVFIVGSKNSSNCNSLCEVVREKSVPVYLIDSYKDIEPSFLSGTSKLGISSGASTPEVLIEEILDFLHYQYGPNSVSFIDVLKENVSFKFPKELSDSE